MKVVIIFLVFSVAVVCADDPVTGVLGSVSGAAGQLTSTVEKAADAAFDSAKQIIEKSPLQNIPNLSKAIDMLQQIIDGILNLGKSDQKPSSSAQ